MMELTCPICFTEVGPYHLKCPNCKECLDENCDNDEDCKNNHVSNEE